MRKFWGWMLVLWLYYAENPLSAQQFLQIQGKAERLYGAINSPLDEVSPVWNTSTGHLYFTRLNHPENVGGRSDKADIWYVLQESKREALAVNADVPLNNAALNHLIGFSEAGQMLYLFHEVEEASDTQHKINIAYSQRKEDSWTAPQRVDIPYFWNKSKHPSGWVSPEGNLLLLALESFASYGNEDLYVSFKGADDSWSPLKNLGADINTLYQEHSPFLLRDRRTLIFATNGRNGYGSWDLYQSKRLDDSWLRWSAPENLGEAINTPGAETFFFIPEKENIAYFVSTQNSDGYSNIWQIPVALQQVEAKALAQDTTLAHTPNIASASTKMMLQIQAMDQSTGAVLPKDTKCIVQAQQLSIDTTLTVSADGKMQLPWHNSGTYVLEFILQDYLPLTQAIEIEKYKEVPLKLAFEKLKKGDVLLGDVYFVQGKAEFFANSQENLQKMVAWLKENPNISLFIAGHTDNQGSAAENLQLSKMRVQVIMDYLIDRGIDKVRLSGKGYGSTQPVASNRNEKERSKNRRVEFIIK